MGFFDNIGKSISRTSQSFISKAGDLADASKLNAQISDEEEKVQKLYIEMGERYYRSHKDDENSELSLLCQSVSNCLGKIEALKVQLSSIKKVKTCPKCGAECSSSTAYCSVCGTELPKIEDKPVKYCSKCGKSIAVDAAFCPFCGNKEEWNKL